MKTITVELDNPILYGSFITIEEPTGKIAHLVGILKVEIGAATKKSLSELSESLSEAISAEQEKNAEKKDGKKESEAEDPSGAGEAGYQMLIMGGGDMPKVMITLKEILRVSAQMAGEKAFTASMFDKLAFSDVEKVLQEYIGNFIAA